jgi:hypothetical protein
VGSIERESRLQNRSAMLAMRVRSIPQGDNPDERAAQLALGYQLQQKHLGLITWVEKHNTDHDALGQLSGSQVRSRGF